MPGRQARPIDPTFGQCVRRERDRWLMSRPQLCEAMQADGIEHWHRTTVQRVENGQQRVDVEELAALVRVLGTDVLVGTLLGERLGLTWAGDDAPDAPPPAADADNWTPTIADVLPFPCDYCGAAAGTPCIGAPGGDWHMPREYAAHDARQAADR